MIEREIDFLNNDETLKLINSIENIKHKLIVVLMVDCGLRVSETISLRYENFDFKKKILTVNSLKKRENHKRTRSIPLSDRLYNLLAEFLYKKQYSKEDLLFPKPNDKTQHITRQSVNNFLRKKKAKLNINQLHPHALRHTFATSHIANGTPLENIKVMLGHQKYDTTLIYAHIPAEILKQNIDNVTADKKGIIRRTLAKFYRKNPTLINIPSNPNKFVIGRENERFTLLNNINKDINTIVLGDIGVGKSHLIDSIQPDKKIIKLDDTGEFKKSLVYIIIYLLKNDKEQFQSLIFGDLDLDKIKTRVNRETNKYLIDLIHKLVQDKEYILQIDNVDRITPKVVKSLTELKDTFVILTTAREVPINKSDFMWNFEVVRLKEFSRTETLELIQKVSYDLEVEDYDLYKNHIFEQTNGNPRAIIELVDRYRKEPVITNEVIREIRHYTGLKEIDFTMFVFVCLAGFAILRYLGREVENDSYRFIGGVAMVLLVVSRYFIKFTKKKFV